MKRLLVFCPYYPPHIGGLESHAAEFNRYISKKDFLITVFTPKLPKDSLDYEKNSEGIEVIRFPAVEIIPNYPLPCFWQKKYWHQWRIVNGHKYDWVISRTRFFLTSVMAGVYAKIYKVSWLHIEHGSDLVKLNNRFYSVMAKLFDYTLGAMVLRLADEVVANSKASAEFCKKLYGRRKYEVIYRGIEAEDIRRVKLSVNLRNKFKDKFIILFAGRLIDGKGVGDLIEAVGSLKAKNWVLLIVGDGPKKSEWEKEASDKIIFLGQKNRDELIGVMKIADVVVNPSYTEGLPTSMIEAAVCGKPVVATDVGGTREIVEDGVTGYLVEAKNILQLTEKIEALMKKNLVVDKFLEKFDWQVSIKKYLKILKC